MVVMQRPPSLYAVGATIGTIAVLTLPVVTGLSPIMGCNAGERHTRPPSRTPASTSPAKRKSFTMNARKLNTTQPTPSTTPQTRYRVTGRDHQDRLVTIEIEAQTDVEAYQKAAKDFSDLICIQRAEPPQSH